MFLAFKHKKGLILGSLTPAVPPAPGVAVPAPKPTALKQFYRTHGTRVPIDNREVDKCWAATYKGTFSPATTGDHYLQLVIDDRFAVLV